MKFSVSNFFSDIGNFFHGGRVVGVDIGTASVKVAEISKKSGSFQLLNYGILQTTDYLEHPNQALQSESLWLNEEVAGYLLKTALLQAGITAKTGLMSLPAFSSFVTVLDMPLLSFSETERAVQFQARQVIPLSPDKVSLDWSKIEETENQQGQRFQKVLLVGIPTDVIELYKRVGKQAGLRVVALELESLALIRAFYGPLRATQGEVSSRPTIFVDIGAEATNVVVAEGEAMKYGVQSPHGGLYLTHALQSSLGVNMSRAEDLKKRRGLLGSGAELELSTLLLSFLDVIIEEIRNTKTTYETRFGKRVEQLVLFGGGAELLGVDKYIGEKLQLPLLSPQIFLDVAYDPALLPAMKHLPRELAVAVGVARRYFT